MVRMTFFGARPVGLFVWLTLLVSGCASILGNDFEVDENAATVGTGASGSTSASSTGGAAGTGGTRGTSGAAGSLATGSSGSSGAGGSVVTAGASGAGGVIAGASGASGTGGSAGLDPDAGDSNVPDSSVADTGTTDAPTDQSQGVDAAPDRPIGSDSGDVASIDSGGVVDAPVCNPINGSCGGGGLTCNGGFASCNGNVTDGCECATSGCCGASCQVQHVACMLNGNPATPCTDGTGIYFYDCAPQGTFNSIQANSACAAVAGAIACSPGTCPGGHSEICSFDGVSNCVCWEYAGSNAGRVFRSNNANCFCPGSTAPTWN